MQQTILIRVSGKVQGVFYRQATRDKARELGLTGQVKNLVNGDVEIIATGTKNQLELLQSWCRQGPPRAMVSAISIDEVELKLFDQFSIER